MLVGISKNETVEHIVTKEQGKDNPTVFLIGNLTNRDKSRLLMGAINQSGLDMVKLQDKAIDIVLAGLKGIRNIKVDGEVQNISAITESVIDLLDFETVAELMSKILEVNFMSGQETKN